MPNLRITTKFWLGFDRHYPDCDPLVDKIVTEFLDDFRPQIRVAGGDWNSCDQANPFNNEHQKDIKPELEQTHQDLVRWKITDWKKETPKNDCVEWAGKLQKEFVHYLP